MNAYAHVRTAFSIGAMRLPHRIVMGSMHTGLDTRDDGGAALAAFYRERVAGGAGLIITGGLAVNSVGRGGPDYAVLGEQAVHERWAAAVDAVHEGGGTIAAQLFHAGRYALVDEQAVAPSAIAWSVARGAVPRSMTGAEIRATIADFAAAASEAVAIGFDAVEIMASEGYLINQFCSPLTNQRDDRWGGDSVRRRRFALAVLEAVRAAVGGDIPVLVRISADDLMPGSSTRTEVDELAVALVDGGAAALSIGIGWHESRVPTVQASVPHGAWLGYAEAVAAAVTVDGPSDGAGDGVRRVPVIASNRITDLVQAEHVLERGTVDAVALARPFLADPAIVEHSFAGREAAINACIGCDQACIDRSLVFQPISCLVNPRAGRESEFLLRRRGTQKRFAVVGGGPAGLAAALDLAERGHSITLFETDRELGGQFTLAARIPGKEDYALTPRSAHERLQRAGAELRLGVAATAGDLTGFDGVILATGVLPRGIGIPGSDLPHVFSYETALRDGVPSGSVAIIGGGGIGVDVATYLVESHDQRERAHEFAKRFELSRPTSIVSDAAPARGSGRAQVAARNGSLVTVLRRSGRFGAGVGITSRWVVLGALRSAGVRMQSDLRYRSITDEGVEIEYADGGIHLIPGQSVIVCAGQLPNDPLADALRSAGIRHEVVGGARSTDGIDAVRASSEGLEAARRLTND